MGRIERRKAVRIEKPIEIDYSSSSPPIRARTADLSEGGLFLDTHHPLAVGMILEFSFQLPDGHQEPIEGKGRVAWVEPMVGVGVEFLELSDEVRERIKFYVASVFSG